MHGHSSWSKLGLHLLTCPKALKFVILKKIDHGSLAMEKMPFDLGQLHGPWCKQPLGPDEVRYHSKLTTLGMIFIITNSNCLAKYYL